MFKIIILCLFIVLGLFLIRNQEKKEILPIHNWISSTQKHEISSDSIVNKDSKVIRFENKEARISLSPGSELVFKNLELSAGSMRIQSLWMKQELKLTIKDLKFNLKFGDFFIKKINKDQYLFLTIKGLAEVSYNNFKYQIKDSNLIIYEINSSSANLIRLYSSEINTEDLKKILNQNSSEFIDLNFNEKILDLELQSIKFQN